jgi:hypothetical protein
VADGFGLRNKLDARIASARRRLFWPSLVRSALPTLVWFTAFAVFWLTGLYTALPVEVQATIGVVFWVGLLTAVLIGLKVWHSPTDAEASDLIDASIEGRPLATWADRPSKIDATGWTLWQEHRDRMAALALKQGKVDVRPQWKQADPFYLRYAAPALLVIAGAVAGTAVIDRFQKGLFPDYGALFGAHQLKIEAWITPPAYTGSAPFVLTPGETAKAPEGSEVTIRIIGPGHPQVMVLPEPGGGATLDPQPGIDGAYEARVVVKQPMRVTVNFWGERASFPFTIIDDASPTVAFVTPPKLGDGDRTEFKYKLADDYGVAKLELIAVRKDTPKEAGEIEDGTLIETVTLAPKEEEGDFSQDLVRHRWAGLDVMVKLRATDDAGQTAESEAVAYRIPEKIFLQPNARMAQEARAVLLRNWEEYNIPPGADNFTSVEGTGFNAIATAAANRLTWAPEQIKRAVMTLDAITWRPEDFFEDPVIYMGLRNARTIIESAADRAEAESAEGVLWDIALRAEYGSLADATAALEAARRALEEALRRGASDEEIKRLMDMYEQAIENYLAAQMAEALRNGNVTQGDGQQMGGGQPGQQPLGDDELTRMLQALRDLAETGARDQARQLLSDMQRMLDKMQNMQIQMGQGGSGQQQDGPMNRAMNRALQDTNRALNDQRDLNDQTEEAQRNGAQNGQQLADQQRQLRERLEQQMRSGGGQPQQPGQQQGQQPGQGQQGQGQQGQGQQGQGQQGQGQKPGQGQQGQGQQGQGSQGNQPGQQQGQGQGQGQQADRGGPGGQPGRPGVQGDGRYSTENERTRRLLGNAIEMQKRAEDALRRGDFAAARDAQQQAMSSLQDRSSELARINDENDPNAQQERDDRDILGRLNNGESGFGENVKIPDELERQKARDILDEIRRRAGNRTLSREELEYLNRLLERF